MSFRPDFPLPDTAWPPTREFWSAAACHALAIPVCDGCHHYVWYPATPCRHCGNPTLTWTDVGGRGTLFAWSVVRRPFIPQLADAVPFVTALVALAEDPAVRIVTRIVDADPERLRADMPVKVVFRPLRFTGVAGEVVAPLFAPA